MRDAGVDGGSRKEHHKQNYWGNWQDVPADSVFDSVSKFHFLNLILTPWLHKKIKTIALFLGDVHWSIYAKGQNRMMSAAYSQMVINDDDNDNDNNVYNTKIKL